VHTFECDAKSKVCCASPLTWNVPPGEEISRDTRHTCPVQNSVAVSRIQSSKSFYFWKIHWKVQKWKLENEMKKVLHFKMRPQTMTMTLKAAHCTTSVCMYGNNCPWVVCNLPKQHNSMYKDTVLMWICCIWLILCQWV